MAATMTYPGAVSVGAETSSRDRSTSMRGDRMIMFGDRSFHA